MEFEFETSDDDFSQQFTYANTGSAYSKKTSSVNPKKGSSLLFGGNAVYNDDASEENYDFEFDGEAVRPNKGASSSNISTFSPRVGDIAPKPTTVKSGQTAPASAMERAQQMLEKYSKPQVVNNKENSFSGNQRVINKFKKGKAEMSFDEEEISIDEESSEQYDESSMSISSPRANSINNANNIGEGNKTAVLNTNPRTGVQSTSNKLTQESQPQDQRKFKQVLNDSYDVSASVSFNAMEVSHASEVQDTVSESIREEVDNDADENEEDGDNNYSDEEFDADDDEELVTSRVAATKSGRVENDSDNDNDNGSYSRIVYGNEEDIDSDEIEESEFESSKPKIMSFADLTDISGWQMPEIKANDPLPIANAASATDAAKPSRLAGNPSISTTTTTNSHVQAQVSSRGNVNAEPIKSSAISSAVAKSTSASSSGSGSGGLPSSSSHQQQHVHFQSSPPSLSNPAIDATTRQLPSSLSGQTNHFPTSVPVAKDHQSAAAPAAAPTSEYEHERPRHTSQDPVNTAYQSSMPPPPPSYYPPYMYPPQQPYGYPPAQPIHPYQGQQPMYYPPPPPGYYHPLMPPYYCGYPAPYVTNPPSADATSLRPGIISSSLSMPSGLMPPSSSLGADSSQAIIVQLLSELNKAKEEANWSKQKLAEAIMLLKEPEQAQATQSPQAIADLHEETQDYSQDFEVSRLSIQSPVREPAPAANTDIPTIKPSSSIHLVKENLTKQNSSQSLADRLTELLRAPASTPHTAEFPPSSSSSSNSVQRSADNPLAASIAKSFIASQELLRSKLESLRMKIEMTKSINSGITEIEENIFPDEMMKSSTLSLQDLKAQIQKKKDLDALRMAKLLRDSYPDLQPSELVDLIKRFQSN